MALANNLSFRIQGTYFQASMVEEKPNLPDSKSLLDK